MNIAELDPEITLDALGEMLAEGETFIGEAPVGDTGFVNVLRGTQLGLFHAAATNPVLNERGDAEIAPALPGHTTLADAVDAVRKAYRLSANQRLFGVIDEFTQRRARNLADPTAKLSPRSERAKQTWLGALNGTAPIGGRNSHIDAAIAKTDPAVRSAVLLDVVRVKTQGDWSDLRVTLAGLFGEWKFDRRPVDGSTDESDEARPKNPLHADNTPLGTGASDDEPF
jgi:hypothetical protein